jgi:hypothetical protein
MVLTKQNYQDIARYLSRISVRDSEFPKAEYINDDSTVVVVSDGKNVRVDLPMLAAYVANSVDVLSTDVDVEGLKATDLISALNELYSLASTKTTYEGAPLTASAITFSNSAISSTTVAGALGGLIDIIYGKYPFPTAATNEQILNILN